MLEDMTPLERFAASSECNILLPTGGSTKSGGDEPKAAALVLEPWPNAESCRLRRAEESAWYEEGGEPARNLAGTEDAMGPYRAM